MDNENEDVKLAEKMFGRVGRVIPTHNHVPDKKRLCELFEWNEAIAYSFCKGCGTYLEVSREAIMYLAEKLMLEAPASLDGMYVETSGCMYCIDHTHHPEAFFKYIEEVH